MKSLNHKFGKKLASSAAAAALVAAAAGAAPIASATDANSLSQLSSDFGGSSLNGSALWGEEADGTGPQDDAAPGDSEIIPLGSCGDTQNVSITGASAEWSLSCRSGEITATGTVSDTLPDGRCARITANFADGTSDTKRACGFWTTESFTWDGPGRLADVYLSVG